MGSMWLKATLIGIVTGFAVGLLGIGGGIVVVPAFVLILKMDQYSATATSSATIVMPAAAALAAFATNGSVDWSSATVILAGSSIGAWLGARYLDRVPEYILAGVFSVVMLISSIQLAL